MLKFGENLLEFFQVTWKNCTIIFWIYIYIFYKLRIDICMVGMKLIEVKTSKIMNNKIDFTILSSETN